MNKKLFSSLDSVSACFCASPSGHATTSLILKTVVVSSLFLPFPYYNPFALYYLVNVSTGLLSPRSAE